MGPPIQEYDRDIPTWVPLFQLCYTHLCETTDGAAAGPRLVVPLTNTARQPKNEDLKRPPLEMAEGSYPWPQQLSPKNLQVKFKGSDFASKLGLRLVQF